MPKEEFAVLAEKYMDTIYRVAYSWTKNSDDANDVTQDVLIQLYKTKTEFDSDSHLKKLVNQSHRQSMQNAVPFSVE